MDIVDVKVIDKSKTFERRERSTTAGYGVVKGMHTVWTFLATFETSRGQQLRVEVPEKRYNRIEIDDKGELTIKRGRFKKFR